LPHSSRLPRSPPLSGLLRTKGAQIAAGASTAWVPSPTAATLHALHYLQTSVASVQGTMATAHKSEGVTPALFLADLITPPLMTSSEREALTPVIIQKELDNNVQSLLGYVVRWVGQGVGCSKVRPRSLSPSPHLPHPHTSPVSTPSSFPAHLRPLPFLLLLFLLLLFLLLLVLFLLLLLYFFPL
jgi:hypothetical protein